MKSGHGMAIRDERLAHDAERLPDDAPDAGRCGDADGTGDFRAAGTGYKGMPGTLATGKAGYQRAL